MLVNLLNNVVEPYQIIMIGILFGCLLTLVMLKCEFKFLPQDQGRAFAVNGELSKGKIRGVGIIMVACFILASVIFVPVTKEYVIYAILLFAMMLSGYLDDMSKIPWSDYKKGLIDFVISLVTVVVFIKNNSTDIVVFGNTISIHPVLYGFLAIVLIWVSINVTNCSDGVDGLCSSLSIVTLFSFAFIGRCVTCISLLQYFTKYYAYGRCRIKSNRFFYCTYCDEVRTSDKLCWIGTSSDNRRWTRSC